MPAAASDARPEILALESQAAANSLVEACLGRASRLQVIDTFPLLLAAGARSTRFVIRHDEAIVAHAASRDLTIATVGSGALRLANIGGVCTLPQVRGRGLASELVSALVDDARRRGLDGAILWSDRPSFYARMGFVDA
ncbi:MAG: GNAT family N-acetyltransferase, partial [Planctomycetes bacterium]|nr:GNAT family N-acetyltransferase [Planctomycetota bacterium]